MIDSDKDIIMEFCIYTQKEVLSDGDLADRLIDIIVDNMSYLFGDDMGSDENRKEWKQNQLMTDDPAWRAVVGVKCGEILGFIIYTVKNRALSINEFEIVKTHRRDHVLMIGMLQTMIAGEYDSFDTIRSYINKRNIESQKNFLRYATSVSETERGYRFVINEEKTALIKERFRKRENR